MDDLPPLRASVLFVCTGNICRSPTAEGMFRKKLAEAGLAQSVEVDSCGIAGYHVGEPPDARAQQAALRRGIDLSDLRARKLRTRDFSDFSHLLAMDTSHLMALQRAAPDSAATNGSGPTIALLSDFAPGLKGREVPDPYYGDADGFEHVLDLLESMLDGLIETIRSRS